MRLGLALSSAHGSSGVGCWHRRPLKRAGGLRSVGVQRFMAPTTRADRGDLPSMPLPGDSHDECSAAFSLAVPRSSHPVCTTSASFVADECVMPIAARFRRQTWASAAYSLKPRTVVVRALRSFLVVDACCHRRHGQNQTRIERRALQVQDKYK